VTEDGFEAHLGTNHLGPFLLSLLLLPSMLQTAREVRSPGRALTEGPGRPPAGNPALVRQGEPLRSGSQAPGRSTEPAWRVARPHGMSCTAPTALPQLPAQVHAQALSACLLLQTRPMGTAANVAIALCLQRIGDGCCNSPCMSDGVCYASSPKRAALCMVFISRPYSPARRAPACFAERQGKGRQPVRIVSVASKMHELAAGVDVDDPHFAAKGAFSSLAAYNRSKLCQARRRPAPRPSTGRADALLAEVHQRGRHAVQRGEPPNVIEWPPSATCATQVLFTAELRRRLPPGCGVVAAAVHPGEVMTDVVRTLPAPMQAVYRAAMRPFCLSPAQGARPARRMCAPRGRSPGPGLLQQRAPSRGQWVAALRRRRDAAGGSRCRAGSKPASGKSPAPGMSASAVCGEEGRSRDARSALHGAPAAFGPPRPRALTWARRAGARSSVFCATSREPILCEHQAYEADNCYFGSDCRCAAPSAAAGDAALAAWLWRWSADAVALPAQCDLPPAAHA